MSKPPEKIQQGINSIEVGIGVLKGLVSQGRPATLSEIAAAAAVHPAKAHRYLVSLIRSGLVRQDADSGRYDLGPYALEFSLACLSRLDAIRVGAAVLETLVEQIQESVLLAVWSPAGPTVIDWRPARRPISASTHTGTLFSVLMSVSGRVFAAYLPPATVRPLIDAELGKLTDHPRAPRNWDEVETLLSEIRRQGLGRGQGLRIPSINSIGAPVFNHRGEIAFVLTAFGYEETFNSDWDGPIAAAIRETATVLSRQLGYTYNATLQPACSVSSN